MNTELKKLEIERILIKVERLTVFSYIDFMRNKITLNQDSKYNKLIRKAAANMILNLD